MSNLADHNAWFKLAPLFSNSVANAPSKITAPCFSIKAVARCNCFSQSSTSLCLNTKRPVSSGRSTPVAVQRLTVGFRRWCFQFRVDHDRHDHLCHHDPCRHAFLRPFRQDEHRSPCQLHEQLLQPTLHQPALE